MFSMLWNVLIFLCCLKGVIPSYYNDEVALGVCKAEAKFTMLIYGSVSAVRRVYSSFPFSGKKCKDICKEMGSMNMVACKYVSPLYSQPMNDLVDMLNESGVGFDLSQQLINCLLFADDVVLVAKSPEDLQTLLRISHDFATKWNLKFNHKKSKVLVVGKRLRPERVWSLGDVNIEEVNEYKYLGYYINRSLKSNFRKNSSR
ncbi:unnamed protein product [Mytilus edulis]|uniref:Reverse transcriptase domain-containing protein n=1 Tax=Mytilus edulis TaxID=6550 RepID=A0A8S3TR27_MYTED|nr:unnamed protein product [Mytilus edulis]